MILFIQMLTGFAHKYMYFLTRIPNSIYHLKKN